MKKMKLLFLAVALFAVGSAFTTKNVFTCGDGVNVFYKDAAGIYYPLGTPGSCNLSTTSCTYFYNGSTYEACPLPTGVFVPL